MSNIYSPSIELYIYDLRNGLGQNSEDIEKNCQNFRKKLPKHMGNSFCQFDTSFEVEYVELLKNKRFEEFESSDKLYRGYYYPVRLADTYGLLLDYSLKDKINPYPSSYFGKIKSQIGERLKHQSASIGQTWVVTAVLPSFPSKSPELIAKECYQAVIPDGDWVEDFQGEGNLFGGHIFELWRYNLLLQEQTDLNSSDLSQINSIGNIQNNQHVIIILYPNQAIAQQSSKFIFDWIPLFCYHHKIMFAYGQSRYLKQILKKDFIAIQQGITDIKKVSSKKVKIEKIRQILYDTQNILSRYSVNVSYFHSQLRNIDTNLDNYKKRLDRFQEKVEEKAIDTLIPEQIVSTLKNSIFSTLLSDSTLIPLFNRIANISYNNDLQFLETFANQVKNKYLLQLEKDYENLSPGLNLLKGLVNSIRSLNSIIEIDEEERERSFQNNIAILGVGLGSAALFIEASESYVEDVQALPYIKDLPIFIKCTQEQTSDLLKLKLCMKQNEPDSADAVVAIASSILAGIVFSVMTALIIKANTAIGEFFQNRKN